MAPEQVQGKRGDERTDIYSLGAILYEMATGATLFEGENPYVVMNSRLTGDPTAPRKINPKLTPVLEEIMLHALERNPANRYASAAAMKAELDDYEKVQMTERWKRLQPPQIWKTKFLGPIITGVIIVNVLVLALFLVVVVSQSPRSRAPRGGGGGGRPARGGGGGGGGGDSARRTESPTRPRQSAQARAKS